MARQAAGWADRPIGQIVDANYRAAAVFERLGIEYCGATTPLREACAAHGTELEAVEAQLSAIEQESHGATLPQSVWDLDRLADYIVSRHHKYIRDVLPQLDAWLAELIDRSGASHPELAQIRQCVRQLGPSLLNHMAKEEMILFPCIARLAEARRRGEPHPDLPFPTIYHPIRAMEMEHDHAGELMGTIQALSGNYTPPPDGDATWRRCYAELERFEQDLHAHVHLENHILFPRTLELERLLA